MPSEQFQISNATIEAADVGGLRVVNGRSNAKSIDVLLEFDGPAGERSAQRNRSE
jgi:hypothetical protein